MLFNIFQFLTAKFGRSKQTNFEDIAGKWQDVID